MLAPIGTSLGTSMDVVKEETTALEYIKTSGYLWRWAPEMFETGVRPTRIKCDAAYDRVFSAIFCCNFASPFKDGIVYYLKA